MTATTAARRPRRVTIGGPAPDGAQATLDLRSDAPLDAPAALAPEALARSAQSLRGAYIDYIGARARAHAADERWWTSTVAERNPFVSRAFFEIVRVAAAVERIETIAGDGPIHVAVDDAGTAASLAATLEARGFDVTRGPVVGAGGLRDLAELFVRRAYFVSKLVKRAAVARTAGIRSRTRKHGASPIVVVQEWVDQRNFDPATGDLKPFANFAAVHARLRERGDRVATLAFVLRTVPFQAALRALVSSREVVLVPEAFVSLRDVAGILWRSLARPARSYPPLSGIGVQAIFDRDDRRDWIHHRWAETELNAAMVRGWRRAGLRIARVIYSFENHTWERAFCRALAREFPHAARIGFQGPALSRFRLNEYMTSEEWERCPAPHRVVSFSPMAGRELMAAGMPASRLAAGAAPWLGRLLAMPPPSAAQRDVLVILSIDELESREVLERAAAALADLDVTVFAKCHPTMPSERVWKQKPLPPQVRFETRSIAELLESCAVVLYGSSGGALEALGAGVAPIHVRTSRVLDQDPLEPWPALRDVAGSIAELASLVRDRLSETPEARAERQRRGRAALREYVGQDEGAWLEALTA